MNIENCEGRDFLKRIGNGSVDLILTDPPYIISHETGMNALHDAIESGKNLILFNIFDNLKQIFKILIFDSIKTSFFNANATKKNT